MIDADDNDAGLRRRCYRRAHPCPRRLARVLRPAVLLERLAEMSNLGVHAVSAHGEQAAAYMADGYARVLGRAGVCMSQTVGATNIAAGLKDA